MIYKEYKVVAEQTSNYPGDYSYRELVKFLAEGWEVVTSFCHTHPESKGNYEYDTKTGSRRDIFELGNPYVTFILGRNEAPKALYGKE